MSDLKESGPVLFFFSVLYNDSFFVESDVRTIINQIAPIDISFDHDFFPMKDYYSKEMGDSLKLKRCFFLASRAFERNLLVPFKVHADQIEKLKSLDGKRTINIDVGFIALDQVILATGKPYFHRVYLEKGVYANLELFFQENEFKTFPWSYPDYSHLEIRDFFKWARTLLKNSLTL